VKPFNECINEKFKEKYSRYISSPGNILMVWCPLLTGLIIKHGNKNMFLDIEAHKTKEA